MGGQAGAIRGRGGAGACAGARPRRWFVPEDIGFFETLQKSGQTKQYYLCYHVGGAISNARNPKGMSRGELYEAASPLPQAYRHRSGHHTEAGRDR